MPEYHRSFGRGELNRRIDAGHLVENIELDADEIAWRKDFINFDCTDVETLNNYTSVFGNYVPEIGERFYEHLMEFEQTQSIIDQSSKDLDQLKETQQAYLMTLSCGEYDEDYFRHRARIGKIHELLDMPMKHYIGQYNVYYSLFLDIVADQISEQVQTTVTETLEETKSGADEVDSAELVTRVSKDIESGLDELHSLLKMRVS